MTSREDELRAFINGHAVRLDETVLHRIRRQVLRSSQHNQATKQAREELAQEAWRSVRQGDRDEFFDAVEAVAGVRPELLSGIDEGRLSFLGATSDLDPAEGRGDDHVGGVEDLRAGAGDEHRRPGAPGAGFAGDEHRFAAGAQSRESIVRSGRS